MLPSSAELYYFLEVANSSNLSRASERLGISQPSLSLAMQRLEQSVGASLFIRHRLGVTLTQPGKQLLQHTKMLLELWEKTKSQALASQQQVQGYFTIGCPSTMGIHIASEILPGLLEKNPKLEIQLKHDLSRKIVENVINLSVDIAIVANPIEHPDLIIIKLREDEVTFWVGPGKRKIQDFHSNQANIICDPELAQTQFLLKSIKGSEFHYSRITKVNSLEVIACLTAKGGGIGILPACVAASMYPAQLKRISNSPAYRDQLCLIYRNENRNIRAVQVIVDTIKKHFTIQKNRS